MIKVAPSILAADFSMLKQEIEKVEKAGADMLHIDVMDGHFVPNITIGPPVIECLRKHSRLPFDVHLMIDNAEKYIEDFAAAGADIISVHAESNKHLHRVIQKIKALGKRAAVALNPATSISTLDYIIMDIDMVLLMTVNPGFGGQGYINTMTLKIRELRDAVRAMGLNVDIEIDGGITPDNIREVTEAGANVIVAGSAVFKAADPGAAIKELRDRSVQ